MLRTSLITSLLLLSVTGCDGWNIAETGAHGVLRFIPEDCGVSNCDFADDLLVGGTMKMRVDGEDGFRFYGSDLIPEVAGIVDVSGPYSDGRYDLVGVNPGKTDLIVVDDYGYEIDHFEIEVVAPDRVALLLTGGDAVGPDRTHRNYDEIWTVTAYETVSFQLDPTVSGYRPMGSMNFTAYVDDVMAQAMLPTAVERGYISFSAPAGEYVFDMVDAYGTSFRALFVVQ